MNTVPGLLGKLIRKYGWLFGVYLAISGAGVTLMGILARYMARRMFTDFIDDPFPGMDGMLSGGSIDSFGDQMTNTFSSFATNNPVSIMGGVFIVLGILMIIGGVALAIILKRRSEQ